MSLGRSRYGTCCAGQPMTSGALASLTSGSPETRARPWAKQCRCTSCRSRHDRPPSGGRIDDQVVMADQIGHAAEVDVEVEIIGVGCGQSRSFRSRREPALIPSGIRQVRTRMTADIGRGKDTHVRSSALGANHGALRPHMPAQRIDQHPPQRCPASARGENHALVHFEFDLDLAALREARHASARLPRLLFRRRGHCGVREALEPMPPALPSTGRTPRPSCADRGGKQIHIGAAHPAVELRGQARDEMWMTRRPRATARLVRRSTCMR